MINGFKKYFKVAEDVHPDSFHRVKQRTTLPLNIQVGFPENNLSSPFNGTKEAFSSSKLFSIKSC